MRLGREGAGCRVEAGETGITGDEIGAELGGIGAGLRGTEGDGGTVPVGLVNQRVKLRRRFSNPRTEGCGFDG